MILWLHEIVSQQPTFWRTGKDSKPSFWGLLGEQTFYVCSHVIECKENATLLSTSTISSLEKYPEILRSFLFLQIIENKCLQLIPHGFLFSSREKLDFTVEGIELHPEKKGSYHTLQKFVHSTRHSLHFLPWEIIHPLQHNHASMTWLSTRDSAHRGRAAWAGKRHCNTDIFYSWTCNLVLKEKKYKKREKEK